LVTETINRAYGDKKLQQVPAETNGKAILTQSRVPHPQQAIEQTARPGPSRDDGFVSAN
jgi:hypothetical protein